MASQRVRTALLALAGVLAVGLGVLATTLLQHDPQRAKPRSDSRAPASDGRSAQRPPAKRLFSASSVWNAPLAADAPLDPASAPLMAAFNAQLARERKAGIGPWIQADEASTPIYRVGPGQARVPVELQTGPWGAKLEAALARGVPIPEGAKPAAGPDRHLTVYQPSTDTLWELWRATVRGGRWTASWGGVMRGVSRSPGYFTDTSFPGSGYNWGATATSLPVAAGVPTIGELRRGRIDHALALDVPDARKGTFSWPAQRSDGDGGPDTLPEGARMRLDPALDVDSLDLSRTGRALALAAQRYGVVVRDVTHHATAFYVEDPTPTGRDPYNGPDGIFGGSAGDALRNFPWQRLQLLRMSLCTEAPCPPRGTGPATP